MSYRYQDHREWTLTDEGQRALLRLRDWVAKVLQEAGAFQLGHGMNASGVSDSWKQIALVDRLGELGEITALPLPKGFPSQFQVFIRGRGL